MKKVKKNINYKKERVVLSDILPYEVPPFFSNQSFYHFLIKNKIEIYNNELRFKKENNKTLEKIIRIVFGLFKQNLKENVDYNYFKIREKDFVKIPFKFKVKHKADDFRELTVIHPFNQLLLVKFYDIYKYNIIHDTQRSLYSLRKPYKIASIKYYKDNTNLKNRSLNSDVEIIETTDKEYVSLKSFFSYEKYSNIYKFYESFEYQRAEKRFNYLLKFDISRCFDSIYTHSLSWAIINKKIVKENVSLSNNTYGGKFDILMQKMNYNETNGIIIGPEFSRIFAEIILQKIDDNVEKELKKKYKYKTHYDIYRYVDDYFVFYSDDKVKDEILSLYKIKLQEYNLFFNDSKTEVFSKPIITNITIAKEKIRELVEKTVFLNYFDDNQMNTAGVKFYTAKDVITNYKLILSITETSYKDLQNYFLAIIFNKTKDLIKTFQKEQNKLLNLIRKNENAQTEKEKNDIREKLEEQFKILKKYHKLLYKNLINIIELTFFIYSVLPRVSYSIKVSHISYRIIDFFKNQQKMKQTYNDKIINKGYEQHLIAYDFDKKHTVFKLIFDNIHLVFKKNRASLYAEIETLYLLQVINELGKEYSFGEDLLINHFNIKDENNKINDNLNYFTIMSLLNHIKHNKKYENLKKSLLEIIKNKFDFFEDTKAELIFLLIDVLNCPYVGFNDQGVKDFKRKILNKIKFFNSEKSKSEKNKIIDEIIGYQSNWFYKWNSLNFGKELNTKRGHNVY